MPFTKGHKIYGGTKTRFKKGYSVRIGMKHTEASKRLMSESRKGKAMGKNNPMANPEMRKRVSEAKGGIPHYNQRGEKHGNWKGGITPINAKIRQSLEYKLWRKAVYERDNYTCVWCGVRSKRGKSVILHADHIKPFAYYPELRFAIDNGRTLCIDCHKTTDTYMKKGGRI